MAALTGVSGFAGWMVKWALAHLESDLTDSRKSAHRGTSLAEKGADVAESGS